MGGPVSVSPEAAGVLVAASERVGAGERHDALVVEAHAVEDVAQVRRRGQRRALVGVGEAPVGRALLAVRVVGAAEAKGDRRPAHGLHGHHPREGVQVRRAQARELVVGEGRGMEGWVGGEGGCEFRVSSVGKVG